MMKMNYEQSVKRLREIIAKLKDDNTSLEDTAKLYKEGLAILNECKSTLDKITSELEEPEK